MNEIIEDTVIEKVIEESVPEQPVVIEKREVSVQTEKRQITQKQLDALARGRKLNLERRDAYKKWHLEQQKQEQEQELPPPIVRQEVPMVIPRRVLSFV